MSMTQAIDEQLNDDDVEAIGQLKQAHETLRAELAKVIVGQEQVIEELTICLFARGHALLTGVPGLAKTMLIRSLAETLSLDFSRIQFTPDLMPMDITGTDILQQNADGSRAFEFIRGPVFASIILADEINRAPAKTQAAMLEAMQEQRVTISGRSMELPQPFFVLATQNPVEQEGTYPLPEAQLDRFMFEIEIDYPSRDEEVEIGLRTTVDSDVELQQLLDAQQVMGFQSLVRRMPIARHLLELAADLTRATRPDHAPDWLKPLVAWGAGPRAVQNLVLGAKSRAALNGRFMVRQEDVLKVAVPVLAHRLLTTFNAESDGVTGRQIVQRLAAEFGKQDG